MMTPDFEQFATEIVDHCEKHPRDENISGARMANISRSPARAMDERASSDSGRTAVGRRNFDLAADGRMVVLLTESEKSNDGQSLERVNVELNWTEALKQRVPMR